MHLPRAAPAQIVERSEEDGDIASFAGRVLIVEDDSEVAEVASLIDQLGYKYRLAGDAEAARTLSATKIRSCLQRRRDARRDGWPGFGPCLRKLYPGVPILLASAHAPDEATEVDIPLLSKPYGLEDLRRAINTLLRKSERADENNLVRFPNKPHARQAVANPDNR
jgi:DNA-binding response OmpR family regulator